VFIQQGVEEIIQWHFASVCSLFVLLCDEKWKFAGRLGPWASRTSVVHVMLRGPFHAVWTTRFFACFARNVTGSKTSQVQLCPSCRSYLNCQCAFENVSICTRYKKYLRHLIRLYLKTYNSLNHASTKKSKSREYCSILIR
jgi:hypothetical protein